MNVDAEALAELWEEGGDSGGFGHYVRQYLFEQYRVEVRDDNLGRVPVEIVLRIASRLPDSAARTRLRLLSKPWNRILESAQILSLFSTIHTVVSPHKPTLQQSAANRDDCLLMLHLVQVFKPTGYGYEKNDVLLMAYRPSLKAWFSLPAPLRTHSDTRSAGQYFKEYAVFPVSVEDIAFSRPLSGRTSELPLVPLLHSFGGLICCAELAESSEALLKRVVIANPLTGMQTYLPALPIRQPIEVGGRLKSLEFPDLDTPVISLAIAPFAQHPNDSSRCFVFFSIHTACDDFPPALAFREAATAGAVKQLYVYKHNADDSASAGQTNVNRWRASSEFRLTRVKVQRPSDLERLISAADFWNFYGEHGLFYVELFKFYYDRRVSLDSFLHVPTWGERKIFKWNGKLILLAPQASSPFPQRHVSSSGFQLRGFTVYELRPLGPTSNNNSNNNNSFTSNNNSNNNNNSLTVFDVEWVEVATTPSKYWHWLSISNLCQSISHNCRRDPKHECYYVDFVVSGNLAYMIRQIPFYDALSVCRFCELPLFPSFPYLVYNLHLKSWYLIPSPPSMEYRCQVGFLPLTYSLVSNKSTYTNK